MRSEIVGREGELAAVDAFLDAPREGPAALVLEGSAAIGKSTLWLAALEKARARGLGVLSTRPAEAEQELAFAGLGNLLEDVLEDVVPLLRRRALEGALLLGGTSERVDPRALGVAVRTALEVMAAGANPLVVAVDDVQWLDRSSTSALSFALSGLDA